MRFVAGAILLIALESCGPMRATDPRVSPEKRHDFDTQLLEIARGYEAYGRVDDLNRWAPTLCRPAPSEARFSQSDDVETHGGKIYYVFARDREAYVSGREKTQPLACRIHTRS